MTPIISATRFKRYPSPSDILPLINVSHRGSRLLAHMCSRYPNTQRRRDLMEATGFTVAACGGPICAAASFEFQILRINDRLPRTGWRIATDGAVYKLEPIERGQERADRTARHGIRDLPERASEKVGGCQCLQRLFHAERTGREPRARPAVTAGRRRRISARRRQSIWYERQRRPRRRTKDRTLFRSGARRRAQWARPASSRHRTRPAMTR